MNVLPVLLGVYISTLFTGLHVNLLMAAVTFTAAFLMGVSLMFALSTILVRSKAVLAIAMIFIIAIIVWLALKVGTLQALGLLVPPSGSYMDGSWGGVLIAIALFIALSAFSLLCIREKPAPTTENIMQATSTKLKNPLRFSANTPRSPQKNG